MHAFLTTRPNDLVKPIHPTRMPVMLVGEEAHDGLELSGWLYRPRDATKAGPYVISFHGGPEGQERPYFRSVYQALLTRGIGVFAPNVRGSSCFGKRFVNLDNGELRFKAMPAPAQGVTLAAVGIALSLVATSQVVPYIYFQF